MQRERKRLPKRSNFHGCLRWPLLQSGGGARALRIQVQLPQESGTAMALLPLPSDTTRLTFATATRPGKAKAFSFPHSWKSRRSHLVYPS